MANAENQAAGRRPKMPFGNSAKFSSGAREYARGIHTQKIVLVDGHDLAELMIDYGAGVSTKVTFEIKEPDKDFFEEDASL